MAVSNVSPLLVERSGRIADELDDRIEADLSAQDWCAITTALGKSILAGFCEGYAELATNAIVTVTLPTGERITSDHVELGGSMDFLSATNMHEDEWHERYDGEDD